MTSVQARGDIVGDGVRIHSMALPGLVSSHDVRFAGPGEVLTGILTHVSPLLNSSILNKLFRADVVHSARRCESEGAHAGPDFGYSKSRATQGHQSPSLLYNARIHSLCNMNAMLVSVGKRAVCQVLVPDISLFVLCSLWSTDWRRSCRINDD